MRIPSARLLVVVALCAVSGTGCRSDASPYNFSCPELRLQQLDLLTVSADGRDLDLLGERLDAIQVDAERAADCDGQLIVVAWSESASTSAVLYSGSLTTTGATEVGRDRKIPEVVDGVMGEIRGSLNTLFAQDPAPGNDLVAAYSIISDFARSHPADSGTPRVNVYTDGISTVGSGSINRAFLTEEQVSAIVAEQSLPSLNGLELNFYGIGRVSGDDQPPQQVVATAIQYAQELCAATGAECSVFTSSVAA